MNSILSVLEGVIKVTRRLIFWIGYPCCAVAIVVAIYFWWTWAFSAAIIAIAVGAWIGCIVVRRLGKRLDDKIDVWQEANDQPRGKKQEFDQQQEVRPRLRDRVPDLKPHFKRRPKSEAVEAVITED